jgi:hypothetical protein
MGFHSYGLKHLQLMQRANSLGLVDKEHLVRKIISSQSTSPGGLQKLARNDLLGLLFVPGSYALQNTYFSLAGLEILGSLDRIDREACIQGILRNHHGKGFFKSSGDGQVIIDGSARDTITAFESLRILGALDRVEDLKLWQFRPLRNGVAENQITWHDVEAWISQQRLQKILNQHTQNPPAPYGSLLRP